MGFYIPENTSESKQHINLSECAWLIIEEDNKSFQSNTKFSFSGFMNTIFKNYHNEADASISERYIQKSQELESLYNSPEFITYDYNTKNLFIGKILESYQKQLEEKAHSHKKGIGKKFRINKENADILHDSKESINYGSSEDFNGVEDSQANIGLYLKAIFEEYATLPTYKREQIYFKDVVEKINLAISSGRKLKIQLHGRATSNGTTKYTKKFYFSPLSIAQDNAKIFNYLVGLSEEIDSLEKNKEKKIVSIRITNIEKIDIVSIKSFISKEVKAQIEKEINLKGIQFMAGDIKEEGIIVKFTNKGLDLFGHHLYLRPRNYEILDKYTYKFYCTYRQAMSYFFKMGKDAIIISPSDLRELFIKGFSNAVEAYEEEI